MNMYSRTNSIWGNPQSLNKMWKTFLKNKKVGVNKLRNRNIKKQVYLNDKENELLKKKSEKSGLSESEFIRMYINGYEVKEKPDDNFYNILRNLNGIATNINQIARSANSYRYINENKYYEQYKKVLDFIDDIQKVYLEPNKVGD